MDTGFAETASMPEATPEGLLVALAAEFGPVDARAVERELDRLASALLHAQVRGRTAEDHAEALLGVVRTRRLRSSESVTPDDVLLPEVLVRRVGHPLLLAAIAAAIGRRAGLDTTVVETDGGHLVCVGAGGRTVVADPAGQCVRPPRNARRLCAHEVAFAALGELSRLFALHGRIAPAIRAARLRAALPVPACVHAQIDFEAGALQAQLN